MLDEFTRIIRENKDVLSRITTFKLYDQPAMNEIILLSTPFQDHIFSTKIEIKNCYDTDLSKYHQFLNEQTYPLNLRIELLKKQIEKLFNHISCFKYDDYTMENIGLKKFLFDEILSLNISPKMMKEIQIIICLCQFFRFLTHFFQFGEKFNLLHQNSQQSFSKNDQKELECNTSNIFQINDYQMKILSLEEQLVAAQKRQAMYRKRFLRSQKLLTEIENNQENYSIKVDEYEEQTKERLKKLSSRINDFSLVMTEAFLLIEKFKEQAQLFNITFGVNPISDKYFYTIKDVSQKVHQINEEIAKLEQNEFFSLVETQNYISLDETQQLLDQYMAKYAVTNDFENLLNKLKTISERFQSDQNKTNLIPIISNDKVQMNKSHQKIYESLELLNMRIQTMKHQKPEKNIQLRDLNNKVFQLQQRIVSPILEDESHDFCCCVNDAIYKFYQIKQKT
ncbi:hypothetical protein TRFO_17620 [Tritrichomonas foetus]|uniref:Uncharacterized protein n=1 Tax=Tritrichomonas foetus TaxID=1144522 RepID=A0A1J4KRN5_9EUKA|nr:hypothetical protein TRFO_17620 [Tritrichomonas foetus]|eukprot:OHT12476.1 hypothetical protein TRFO_17620 [Tritrichomonas foetus]